MELMNAIFSRRSIRRYSEQAVSPETLEKIIHAGMMAPSAMNQQPWQFVTVTDKTVLAKIALVNPNAGMAAKAPSAILICGDTNLEASPGYWVQDCSAATQNMLLAAHDMGLGAVWTGIWTRDDRVAGFSKLLSLPETVHPLGLLVIGYLPEESKTAEEPDRFKAERIHSESW